MATSASSVDVEPGEPARKPLLRRTRHRIPPAVWYTLAAFGFALLVVLVQLVLYIGRHEPRDSGAQADRELRTNALQPGERILRRVPVFRRATEDYLRATRGWLVLTDRRLIYLGAPPRDITGASDAPPSFDLRVFPFDTLTQLEPSFTVLGLSRALTIDARGTTLELGVPSSAWRQAEVMRLAWGARQTRLRDIGAWGKRVRDARAELQRELVQYRKQPVYHVVRPGDALSSIASWYETSPEKIQQLNGIVGNKIKVGQKLLIRSGS